MKRCYSFLLMIYLISGADLPLFAVYFGLIGFFVKFGAGYPELERTTFRLSSSNPALPYISLFLFFNLFT